MSSGSCCRAVPTVPASNGSSSRSKICSTATQTWAGGARMPQSRMRRVDEAVRAVLSAEIAKHLKEPRVGFVTVTGVKTSPDLRHARVYVSVLGDEAVREASLEG